MQGELDEQYLTWIYARIGSPNGQRPTSTHWKLLGYLFNREFGWVVANDDNRVADGHDLRYDFLDEIGLTGRVDPNWRGAGCSVLELLVVLAKRLEFETDHPMAYWFWVMISNLGLHRYNDRSFNERQVEDAVSRLIWRTYRDDGHGGLFPLRNPPEDQRHVQLWDQLSLYIYELE